MTLKRRNGKAGESGDVAKKKVEPKVSPPLPKPKKKDSGEDYSKMRQNVFWWSAVVILSKCKDCANYLTT